MHMNIILVWHNNRWLFIMHRGYAGPLQKRKGNCKIMPLSVRLFNLLRNRSFCSPYSSSVKSTGSTDQITEQKQQSTPMDISLTTGAPSSLRTARRVYIFQPSKSAMTSGRSHINAKKSWNLEFDHAQERWENPLMGWISTRDTMNQLGLKFASAEDAIAFAQKNGWQFEVREHSEESAWKSKSYSSNFKYSPGPLAYIPTK